VLKSVKSVRAAEPAYSARNAVKLYNEGRKEEALRFFFYDVGPSEYTRNR
jgi:hypothetical protein